MADKKENILLEKELKLCTRPVAGSRVTYLALRLHWNNTIQLSTRISDQYVNATFTRKGWRDLMQYITAASEWKEAKEMSVQTCTKKQGQLQPECEVFIGRNNDGIIYVKLVDSNKGREMEFPFLPSETNIARDQNKNPLPPSVTSPVNARGWVSDMTAFLDRIYYKYWEAPTFEQRPGGFQKPASSPMGAPGNNNYQQRGNGNHVPVDNSFDSEIIM